MCTVTLTDYVCIFQCIIFYTKDIVILLMIYQTCSHLVMRHFVNEKSKPFDTIIRWYVDVLFKTKVINNTWVLNVMSYPLRILRYNHLCYMFSRNTKLVLS